MGTERKKLSQWNNFSLKWKWGRKNSENSMMTFGLVEGGWRDERQKKLNEHVRKLSFFISAMWRVIVLCWSDLNEICEEAQNLFFCTLGLVSMMGHHDPWAHNSNYFSNVMWDPRNMLKFFFQNDNFWKKNFKFFIFHWIMSKSDSATKKLT